MNPADPIMTLAVTSTAMPMTQVEDMVETQRHAESRRFTARQAS